MTGTIRRRAALALLGMAALAQVQGSFPQRGMDGVARRLLPGRSSVLGDVLQVAVPLRRSGSAVSLGTAVDRGGTMTSASG